MQVHAFEVVETDCFSLEMTLRFPRVQRIRYDKDPIDCHRSNEVQIGRMAVKGPAQVGLDFIDKRCSQCGSIGGMVLSDRLWQSVKEEESRRGQDGRVQRSTRRLQKCEF